MSNGGSFPGVEVAGLWSWLLTSSLTLGPIWPLIQWVMMGALSQGLKWLGCEADCSHPPNAKVKNVLSYMSNFVMSSWHGAYVSTRDNFNFTYKVHPALEIIKTNHSKWCGKKIIYFIILWITERREWWVSWHNNMIDMYSGGLWF
jgi:hypothetical protein